MKITKDRVLLVVTAVIAAWLMYLFSHFLAIYWPKFIAARNACHERYMPLYKSGGHCAEYAIPYIIPLVACFVIYALVKWHYPVLKTRCFLKSLATPDWSEETLTKNAVYLCGAILAATKANGFSFLQNNLHPDIYQSWEDDMRRNSLNMRKMMALNMNGRTVSIIAARKNAADENGEFSARFTVKMGSRFLSPIINQVWTFYRENGQWKLKMTDIPSTPYFKKGRK